MAETPVTTISNKVINPIIIWNTDRLGVKTQDDFVALLRSCGVDLIWFIDNPDQPNPKLVWLLDRKLPEIEPQVPATPPAQQLENLKIKDKKEEK